MARKVCMFCGEPWWGGLCGDCWSCGHKTMDERLAVMNARMAERERQKRLSEGDRVRELWDEPEPRRLSAEEMAQATEEARELRAQLDVRLSGMESPPANVRLR